MLPEDFEVSIFLTETSSRHSLLTKQKHFHDPNKTGIQSNSSKLTGDTNENAIEVGDAPINLREESEEDMLDLEELPAAEDVFSDAGSLFVSEGDEERPRRSKRPRTMTGTETEVSLSPDPEPLSKKRKDDGTQLADDHAEEETDGKKKMAMNTTYDGFSIYGRVLCLIIKRKDKKGKNLAVVGGQAMMEDWIASTQMPQPPEAD